MVLKCSHTFNLLDARGAISVTERAAYIGRVRNLARAIAQSYYESRERLGFPLVKRQAPAEAGPRMKKRRPAAATAPATLLVEVRTEELPPKALHRLSRAFADALVADLRHDDEFLTASSEVRVYATPRRLAVQITDVLAARTRQSRRDLGSQRKSRARRGRQADSRTTRVCAESRAWIRPNSNDSRLPRARSSSIERWHKAESSRRTWE